MTKKICFRFDVDTHKCAKVGIPNLLALAERKNVKFTFFVNCGRAINLYQSIKAMLVKTEVGGSAYPQLGALRKFGTKEYLRCALFNPIISKYGKAQILAAYNAGHEIGLHGGTNHENWGRFAKVWSDKKITHEIQWGIDQLKKMGITPTTFASPFAVGGERVRKILSQFANFDYVSDDLNPQSLAPKALTGLLDIPTSLCGEGGVAYIEQQIALGRSVNEIVQKFKVDLQNHTVRVLYDHPYFAGDETLVIVEKLIDSALAQGFEICTISEIGKLYETKNSFHRSIA